MDLSVLDEIKEKLGSGALKLPLVIGLAAILVTVAVVAGRMFFTNAATAKEFPADAHSASAVSGQVASGEAESSASAGNDGVIFAHVFGCVNSPGLVQVPSGSRVAAAIDAAGGFGEDAAADSVNLAREIADGEQIRVLSQAELEGQNAITPRAAEDTGASSGGETASGGVAEQDSGRQGSGKVNINTANAAELQTLSGVGEATAQKIVDYRASNGPFSTVEDLMNVSGIGQKKFDKIKDDIVV